MEAPLLGIFDTILRIKILCRVQHSALCDRLSSLEKHIGLGTSYPRRAFFLSPLTIPLSTEVKFVTYLVAVPSLTTIAL